MKRRLKRALNLRNNVFRVQFAMPTCVSTVILITGNVRMILGFSMSEKPNLFKTQNTMKQIKNKLLDASF